MDSVVLDTLRHKEIDKLVEMYGGDYEALIADIGERAWRFGGENAADCVDGKKNGVPIIRLKNVSKSYGLFGVLKDVDLEIIEGEFVAIIGASGNGKSTLMHLIGGLDKPSSGDVIVAGRNIKELKDEDLSRFRNRTIGFVFQFFYLQPFMCLRKNIEIACMPSLSDKVERRRRANEVASAVGLGDKLESFPRQLSGGQMQRAAIARSIVNSPKIILADEPTGNLDRNNSFAIIELFRNIRKAYGTTIVLVTHDLDIARKADRVIKIRDGTVS